jgi:hypothetical protein
MPQEIYKLQRSLSDPPQVLIYNKDQSKIGQFPFTDEKVIALFGVMDDAYKIYVYGDLRPDGKFVDVTGIAPEQEW